MTSARTISPSADPTWQPEEIPADVALDFDPDAANALLDEAGYVDTDGDGVREMPDGSRDLTFRYAERSESENEPALREFITGWLADIGIATEVSVYDDTQLTTSIGVGRLRPLHVGLDAVRRPRPDAVLLHVRPGHARTPTRSGTTTPTGAPRSTTRCTRSRTSSSTRERRQEIVHEMLLHFYTEGSYVVLFDDADLQAYRTDRFEGWLRQPADTGPVLFSNTSPSYVNLTPTGDGSSGGSNTALWIAVAAGAVVAARHRRRLRRAAPGDPGRARVAGRQAVSLRYVLGKVAGAIATLAFVLAFNFFLFRVVDDNPVDNLFRGRNLSASQIASLEERFGVGDPLLAAVRQVRPPDAQWRPRHLAQERPPGQRGDHGLAVADRLARRHGDAAVDDHRHVARDPRRVAAGHAPPTPRRRRSRWSPTRCPTSGSGWSCSRCSRCTLGMFPTGGFADAGSTATGLEAFLDHAHHMVLPAVTLTLAYLGEYMILMRASVLDTVREDYLKLARAKGLRDADVRRRHAVPNALLPLVSLSALNFGFVLSGAIAVEAIYSWPGLGRATFDALEGPDFPVLQGLFLVFSAAVIIANLVADLLIGYLDPRVRTA